MGEGAPGPENKFARGDLSLLKGEAREVADKYLSKGMSPENTAEQLRYRSQIEMLSGHLKAVAQAALDTGMTHKQAYEQVEAPSGQNQES